MAVEKTLVTIDTRHMHGFDANYILIGNIEILEIVLDKVGGLLFYAGPKNWRSSSL